MELYYIVTAETIGGEPGDLIVISDRIETAVEAGKKFVGTPILISKGKYITYDEINGALTLSADSDGYSIMRIRGDHGNGFFIQQAQLNHFRNPVI